MNNEEKALKIAVDTVGERTRNHPANLPHIITVKDACLEMAQWKDEQLESKLMQIIILAQQGYTSGATDEMILKHCKEIINENNEHNTTKTD